MCLFCSLMVGCRNTQMRAKDRKWVQKSANSGRAWGDRAKVTERAQNPDFRRKPQIFADSVLLLEIQAFGGRRKPQKTADFCRKPKISQKTAGSCRLGSVTLGASPLARPYKRKSAKELKRALPHKNCKQPGLKRQPGLGTPKRSQGDRNALEEKLDSCIKVSRGPNCQWASWCARRVCAFVFVLFLEAFGCNLSSLSQRFTDSIKLRCAHAVSSDYISPFLFRGSFFDRFGGILHRSFGPKNKANLVGITSNTCQKIIEPEHLKMVSSKNIRELIT